LERWRGERGKDSLAWVVNQGNGWGKTEYTTISLRDVMGERELSIDSLFQSQKNKKGKKEKGGR